MIIDDFSSSSEEDGEESKFVKDKGGNELKNSKALESILSLRNALLLYKTLKNERIREVSICLDGMDHIKSKYPFFCKFRTAFLYPKK
jgi:hypothetical protein